MRPRNRILVGDAATRLARLAPGWVDCVITSPPFFQLRDYGVDGQLGLEPTVQDWVEALRGVFREVARVLKPSGGLWVDLGDAYSRRAGYGAPPKGMLLAPERLLLALADDGWIVRNKVIWAKTNPMPTSVGDRLNTTYDPVYFLVRNPTYYFDLDAIRLPHRTSQAKRGPMPVIPPSAVGPLADSNRGLAKARFDGSPGHPLGKNPGDVWSLSTRGFKGAHFATFPPALIERPLLATCPERICSGCGSPWRRRATIERLGKIATQSRDRHVRRYPSRWTTRRRLGPLLAACACKAATSRGVVLDPFLGTGTTAVVAEAHHRDWVGVELNRRYAAIARQRIRQARSQLTKPARAA